MMESEFETLKLRFPNYVTEDDRSLDLATLNRFIEDRIVDDLFQLIWTIPEAPGFLASICKRRSLLE